MLDMSGFVDAAALRSDDKTDVLVCDDSTASLNGATSISCDLHGSNISVFESNGSYNANGVTDAMLNNLQIGDLLYIAGLAYDNGTQAINPNVTHGIMWTGQKISTSSFI